MQAESRIRTVQHHELILPLDAHHTEVSKAISIAVEAHGRARRTLSDVTVTADDTHLIVGYQTLAKASTDDMPAEASR